MIKALFFDLFGTVVDWRSSIIAQAKLMKFTKINKSIKKFLNGQ